MTNWTISHDKVAEARQTDAKRMYWLILGTFLLVSTFARCATPHDFGMGNSLKTICHVWEGSDGYRCQDTIHVNSKDNRHGSHSWDYDGECVE